MYQTVSSGQILPGDNYWAPGTKKKSEMGIEIAIGKLFLSLYQNNFDITLTSFRGDRFSKKLRQLKKHLPFASFLFRHEIILKPTQAYIFSCHRI